MPIQFRPDGGIIVDSVEEAVRFEQSRRQPTARRIRERPRRQARSKIGPGWEGFLASLAGPKGSFARKALALIEGSGPTGLPLIVLSDQLGSEKMRVSGVLSGIQKKASVAGLGPDDVVERTRDQRVLPGRLLLTHGGPTP